LGTPVTSNVRGLNGDYVWTGQPRRQRNALDVVTRIGQPARDGKLTLIDVALVSLAVERDFQIEVVDESVANR